MNIHKNSGLTPRGRGILILRLERGEHPQDVATAMCIGVRTVYKWRRRYRAEGIAGLQDRSSRPHTSPDKPPDDVETTVIALRKERRIYHRISASLGVATVMAGDETLEELLRRADVALYQAKETGRNKVMSSVVDHGTAPQQQSAVG